MRLTRRSLLRAGGVAALFGATAFAGCAGLRGGPSGDVGDWQFHTGAVSDTPNRFFGTVDHARLYADREHLPESGRATLESAPYTPLDPGAVEAVAGVGGVQFGDFGTGSSVTFGATVALGSFERGAVEEVVRSEGSPAVERDYRGLTLFEGVEGEAAGGLEGVPGDGTPFTMTAVAAGEGALVVGSVSVRGRNAGMVLAEEVVEAAVDAATGNGPRLRGANPRAGRVADLAGGSTLFAGAEADPALLGRYRRAGGPLGRAVTGLRAGGLGLTVDGDTVELRLVGLYEDAAAAESADVAALVEGAATDAGVSDSGAVERVDAAYERDAVVVTIVGETQSLLDGSAFPSPGQT